MSGTDNWYVPTAHTLAAVKWMHRVSVTMWSHVHATSDYVALPEM